MNSAFDRGQFRSGNSGARSGVVEARCVPRPVQTCSLKAENGGQDVNMPLVHRGQVGWGTSPSPPQPTSERARASISEPDREQASEKLLHTAVDHQGTRVAPGRSAAAIPSRWENISRNNGDERAYGRSNYGDERYLDQRNSQNSEHLPIQEQNYSSKFSRSSEENTRYVGQPFPREERRWSDRYGMSSNERNTDFRRQGGNYGDASETYRYESQARSTSRIVPHSEGYENSTPPRVRASSSFNTGADHSPFDPRRSRAEEHSQKRDEVKTKSDYHPIIMTRSRSVQTSGEPTGGPEHYVGATEIDNSTQSVGLPRSGDHVSNQEDSTPTQIGSSVVREKELDEEERERRRQKQAIEQQQNVLRQVKAARATKESKRIEAETKESDKKLLHTPNRRHMSSTDESKAIRDEYTRTRPPRTKGVLFHRLPDGSIERLETSWHLSNIGLDETQNEETTNQTHDESQQEDHHSGVVDSRDTFEPSKNPWNIIPPPECQPPQVDLESFPDLASAHAKGTAQPIAQANEVFGESLKQTGSPPPADLDTEVPAGHVSTDRSRKNDVDFSARKSPATQPSASQCDNRNKNTTPSAGPRKSRNRKKKQPKSSGMKARGPTQGVGSQVSVSSPNAGNAKAGKARRKRSSNARKVAKAPTSQVS